MRPYFLFFIILTLFSLASCQDPDDFNVSKADNLYFDLAGAIESSVEELKQKQAKVEKKVSQNGTTETQTLQIKDWAEELESFKEVDLNKPVLRDSYRIEQTDSSLLYVAKEEKLAVRQMEIITKGQVREVSVQYRQDSRLFDTQRSLWMKLDTTNILQAYRIKSKQSVIFLTPQSYTIEARVL